MRTVPACLLDYPPQKPRKSAKTENRKSTKTINNPGLPSCGWKISNVLVGWLPMV